MEKRKNFFFCQKEGLHEGEILNKICLNNNCQFEFICDICFFNNHRNHEISSIKLMKIECKTILENKKKRLNDFLKNLEEIRQKIFEEFDSFFEKLKETLNFQRKLMVSNFDQLKTLGESFSYDEIKIEEYFDILLGNILIPDSENIQNCIENVSNLFLNKKRIDLINDFHIDKGLQNYKKNLELNIQLKEKNFHDIIQKDYEKRIFLSPIEDLKNILRITPINFKFKDHNFIKFDLKLSNGNLINMIPGNAYGIIIGNKEFPINKKSIFGFKISCKNWFLIGACYENISNLKNGKKLKNFV